ncbi:MAG: CYTH domain-containing protein, partial [Bacteroidales bacterium]|nr:CYTH domain-containing protein [Bacteroidales bacterium]
KYIVNGEYKHLATSSTYIVQGYIFSNPQKSVRVRLKGDRGYITVKSTISDTNVTRNEWEYPIPASEVNELLRICEPSLIEKTRYIVYYKNQTIEIDEFYGKNEGLQLAEVELSFENQQFDKPPFLGREVTGDVKFLNSNLSQRPFSEWTDEEKKLD